MTLLPLILGMLAAFAPLAIDMYLPALPAMAADLAGDAAGAQKTVAAYFLGVALGQLVYGPLTDRLGRRGPLFVGVGVFVAASLACAWAADMPQMIALRFLQALGGCAGMVVTRAVVRDLADRIDPVTLMGRLMLVMGVAPILAPLLGTLVAAWFGWRGIFVFLALFGALAAVMVVWLLPETHAPERRIRRSLREIMADYAGLLADRRFTAPALAGSGAIAGMFAYIAGSPAVFMGVHGIGPEAYAIWFGVNAAAVIGGGQLAGPLAARIGAVRLFGWALLAMLALTLAHLGAVLAGTHFLVQFALLFGYLAVLGVVLPLGSVLTLQHFPRLAGTASALFGTMQFGLGGVAGVALGLLQNGSAWPMAAVILGCIILAGGSWLRR